MNRIPLPTARRFRARWARLRLAAVLALTAAVLAGCSWYSTSSEGLGPVVDSIVVLPFEKALSIKLNTADMDLFRELLVAQFATRPTVRVFPKPPTTLPNTATLTGLLTQFEHREQTGDGLFLRTLSMSVTLIVRQGTDKEPALTVQRDYSFQRVYPAGASVTTFEYDLHLAVEELSAGLIESLMPAPRGKLALLGAEDEGNGKDYSHPYLVKGIREAQLGRYENAISYWALVLYNPGGPAGDRMYRISDRTLERLSQGGVDPEQVAKLKPLTKLNPTGLVPFRNAVRKALGTESPIEPQVLQLADAQRDVVELNLSRAHENLAQVYHALKRFDLEAYHLSRAYAWDPRRSMANAWITLQLERKLLPQDTDGRALLQLYLRIPPPDDAVVQGGAFDRSVLPPSAIAESAPVRVRTGRADAGPSAGTAPAPAQPLAPTPVPAVTPVPLQPVPLQPVTLPPPSRQPGG